jgi:hypothetical protein
MSYRNSFDGFDADIGSINATRGAAVLAPVSLAVIVVGVIATVLTWTIGSAELGALILSATLAAATGVLVIRQAILAERQ